MKRAVHRSVGCVIVACVACVACRGAALPRIHPIHTHGMFFRLLARIGATVDEPSFRDTVLIRAHEEVDLGVVPSDEGTWMMHCHILEHAEAGMMTTIAVHE